VNEVDGQGCPIEMNDTGTAAAFCPPYPCVHCTGLSCVKRPDGPLMTSWEWCQELDTCAATVDWDALGGST
jgi:hypothetical protein